MQEYNRKNTSLMFKSQLCQRGRRHFDSTEAQRGNLSTRWLRNARGRFVPIYGLQQKLSHEIREATKDVYAYLRDEPRMRCLMYWKNYSRVSHPHAKSTPATMPRSAKPHDEAFRTCVGRDGPLEMVAPRIQGTELEQAPSPCIGRLPLFLQWRLLEGREWTAFLSGGLKTPLGLD